MISTVDSTLTDLGVALAAAEAGAAVARALYGRPVARYDKSETDFATQADIEAEDAIRAVIRAARPGDAVVGEERGESPGDDRAARCWLIDPLCGTLNYAAGTPLAAVNVALVTGDAVPAAVSADPISGEYFCSDGRTAWARTGDTETPLRPSPASTLVDVNCDGSGDFVGPQLLADHELRSRYGPRVLSTTLTLAWVAAGRRAGYVTDGDLRGSVHFTAGIALCRAAGCVVTDFAGEPVHSGRGLIAAADPATHRDLLALLARYR